MSGLGGGPSCVCETVAQLARPRLRISRRAFRPPRIDVSQSFPAFQFDRFKVPLGRSLAVQHVQSDSDQSTHRRKDRGDHVPLFAGDFANEIDDLLQGRFWLVPREQSCDGDGGRQESGDCAQDLRPVAYDEGEGFVHAPCGVSKTESSLDHFPRRAHHGPGDQRHEPELRLNRVGVPFHGGQPAVIFAQAGLRTFQKVEHDCLASLHAGHRFPDYGKAFGKFSDLIAAHSFAFSAPSATRTHSLPCSSVHRTMNPSASKKRKAAVNSR